MASKSFTDSRIDLTRVKSIQLNSPDGELNWASSAKLPTAAKCASHAKSEFNLAAPKELFSYGTKWNNLALNFSSKFS